MAPSELTRDLRVSVYRGLDGLAALRADWERLTASLPEKRFFHLYSWYHSYLTTLAEAPESVRFFAFERDGCVAAIFPLESVTRDAYGIRLRMLQVPLHPHVNLTDFVFDKTDQGNRVLVSQLLTYLRAQKNPAWDVLNIPCALEDSATVSALDGEPAVRQMRTLRRQSDYLTCRNGYGEVDARLASSFRKNLRRLRRRAEERGKLEYRSSRDPQELERLFDLFMEVEASGWKGDSGQGSAIRCLPRVEAFYRSLMREYSADNACAINILLLNGTCIAGQFCLLTNDLLYLLKIGYHESYSQIAPGYLLLDEVLRHYADGRQILGVSFVTDPPWTHLWRAASLAVYDCTIYNNTVRGWLAYLWAKGKQLYALTRRQPSEPSTEQQHPQS
jgi:CelD/BcsL family acetyltransferase involved in cellulose biosynthesis